MASIVKIQPVDQWTGITEEDKATYLEVPDDIDVDDVANKFYGQNADMLVQDLAALGAKVIPCPIKVIYV